MADLTPADLVDLESELFIDDKELDDHSGMVRKYS